MEYLYNYGISQEDFLTETGAMELQPDDLLLCVASGGEIPLNIAATSNADIVAVDTSMNQLRLCRIKQCTAIHLDPIQGASFLGYMKMKEEEREEIYRDQIRKLLPENDCRFWDHNMYTICKGPINAARFEKYIQKVSSAGRLLVGRKNLYRLFECNTIDEQKAVFDRYINVLLLKSIFKTAFHPMIYKNRGIDPRGLTHSGNRDIADFFFHRFRNFCCNTMARRNYYLQYTFFNQVLFPEALPEFLHPAFHDTFLKNSSRLEFRLTSFDIALKNSDPGHFSKLHLSNIGDWMSREEMANLFSLIRDKTFPGDRAVMRYIHLNHLIPESVPELKADYERGEYLSLTDRYPFYSIVPIARY
jgi:S-adenosylmethionine-diacylglycerol 3-amino-3-carboxypropyl transferase